MGRQALTRTWLLIVVVAAVVAGAAAVGPPEGGHDVRGEHDLRRGPYVRDGAGPARAGHSVQDAGRGAQPPEVGPRVEAPVTFLQLNDVYSLVPIDGLGGLARVATLKQQLAAAGRTPFLVMAGDFLGPSVASSVFKGEQMIAALNAAGLDLATLGNHEFDFGDDVLIQRMREARFEWVVSNVIDTNTGQPIGGAAPYLVKTFGALKVGFLGLCLNTDEITPDKLKHSRIVDPLAAAGQYLPILKREGATVIVAVTHLTFATDRALVEKFPEIDLVIGGHEHFVDHVDRKSLAHQQGRVGRENAGAHRRQPDDAKERSSDSTSCFRSPAPFRTTREQPR